MSVLKAWSRGPGVLTRPISFAKWSLTWFNKNIDLLLCYYTYLLCPKSYYQVLKYDFFYKLFDFEFTDHTKKRKKTIHSYPPWVFSQNFIKLNSKYVVALVVRELNLPLRLNQSSATPEIVALFYQTLPKYSKLQDQPLTAKPLTVKTAFPK